MADVYEADDTLLNRSVAVKILHANFASDEAFVARFRREAQAAANLSHPNIVAIYDWGQDGGTYFMVMELVQGRTLREILKSGGAILPERAAEITAEAAAALSIAHQHGVYHRDVKPGNIMITPDGSVKVMDFGIARALDDSEELTRTGAVIGTATYFSPEQAQGLPADERSDVYALGIVLYEMLAGKPPFTGESPVAVAYQHVSETAISPDQINPEAPRELAAIAEHAIRKDPSDRYQSAEELRADLVRYLGGAEPVAAAALIAAAPTTMIPPPAAMPPTPVPTGTQVFDAPAEDRSQTGYWVAVGGLLVILLIGIVLLVRLLSGGETVAAEVEVPDLAGLPAFDAFEALQSLDLKVREANETSDEVEAGLVIRTEPPAGSFVEAESFVTVVVSTGSEQVGVPDVIGENVEVARARIEAEGFEVGRVEYELTEDIDENIVIRQSPDGGATAAPNSPVDLVVSAGPFSIEIPDVSGKTTETAQIELQRAGFESVVTEEEPSSDVLEGFVIGTNPAAGQVVPRDATIVVIVSSGPEPVDVPNLEGLTRNQAESRLNELGLLLVVSNDTVEVPIDSGLIGNVAQQSPSAGTEVEVGSEVVVRLGVARQVAVPNLVGLTPQQAENAAAAVGLNVDLIGTTETSDQALDGTVATQAPAAGTTVDEGSFIDITTYLYRPTVPDFTDMSLAEAQAMATDLGLGTVTQTGTVDTTDENLDGLIQSQDPSPGDVVDQGTDIDVVVYVYVP
jgi:serine/threonine-protein kinase